MKVTLINSWGTDLTVVNNARVSFEKESDWIYRCPRCNLPAGQSCTMTNCAIIYKLALKDADINLIKFLVRGMSTDDFEQFVHDASGSDWEDLVDAMWEWRKTPTHWAPFANGVGAQFHMKVPIFVARQLDKHQIGFVKSEVSRRYIDSDPEFYIPDAWRLKAANVKQGSSDKTTDWGLSSHKAHCNRSKELYKDMLKMGICPEQARMVLPQSMYTEYRWSGSLYGWANLYNQRTDSHTQKETREVAKQIGEQMEEHFPVSWRELTR